MNSGLVYVSAVVFVTWIGVVAYLFKVDRAIYRLESAEKEQDELE